MPNEATKSSLSHLSISEAWRPNLGFWQLQVQPRSLLFPPFLPNSPLLQIQSLFFPFFLFLGSLSGTKSGSLSLSIWVFLSPNQISQTQLILIFFVGLKKISPFGSLFSGNGSLFLLFVVVEHAIIEAHNWVSVLYIWFFKVRPFYYIKKKKKKIGRISGFVLFFLCWG